MDMPLRFSELRTRRNAWRPQCKLGARPNTPLRRPTHTPGIVWRAVCAWSAAGITAMAAAAFADPASPPWPLHRFRYRESFEGKIPKVQLWAKNGKAKVLFQGASTERAADGKRSFKMAISLETGSYWYWGAPVSVPCAGRLRISAKLWVDPSSTARVGFGTNCLYPPTRHSGCHAIQTVSRPSERGKWVTITSDLVAEGEQSKRSVLSRYTLGFPPDAAGCLLDRWSIFIYGRPGDRAVFWLDDIRIEGQIPERNAYLAGLKQRFQQAVAGFRRQVAQWRAEFETGRKGLEALNGGLPPGLEQAAAQVRSSLPTARKFLEQFDRRGYAAPWDVAALRQSLKVLRYGPRMIAFARKAVRRGAPVVCLANNRPVDDTRFKPELFPLTQAPETTLECRACRGEFEPVSLLVFAARPARGFRVKAGDLVGPGNATIPASAIDIRVVKWWFQGAGRSIGYNPKKELKAELLLHDDQLVRVDRKRKENFLRSTGTDGRNRWLLCSGRSSKNLAGVRPVDSPRLQPLDIPAGRLREFWITVHVPDRSAPGRYRGFLRWRTRDGEAGKVPFQITVYPFVLAPSPLIYSIYYRGKLSKDGKPTIGSEFKSEEQYRAEIFDMRDHGVLYPTNYQGWDDGPRLRRTLEIRREAGLPTDCYFNLGRATGAPATRKALETLAADVRKWLGLCRKFGYRDIYFYGIDEASGKRLVAERAAWKTVQNAGGKTFVACYLGTFERMGGLLNCAVLSGPPRPAEAQKWHSVNSLIFCYANPQVGVENPEVYRRNFGLLLWKNGYDGAMDYAYQHAFHHIWDDFDDPRYRDHNFTYPTVHGVVDTIQWEGFREGVDDVRYLATLEKAIQNARAAHPKLAKSARKWLSQMDPSSADLYALRARMAAWTVRLLDAAGTASRR